MPKECQPVGSAFPCCEDLRHLHWLHSVRPCVPHRCAGDGPGHYQRSQAGGFVPASGGLRGLQALRDGLPHRLPEHPRVPAGQRGDAVQLGSGLGGLVLSGPDVDVFRSHPRRCV
ncbi:unnamed protein product [Symbiodinium necroappetens]|uniref:Uncharacterized protein n=1 Tax=Symbiodinium necroappetens TaxID=1628268 RepID=A0A812ZGE8_9DINO|nr:unnamed protein product [Symbiodinium necroappetens]